MVACTSINMRHTCVNSLSRSRSQQSLPSFPTPPWQTMHSYVHQLPILHQHQCSQRAPKLRHWQSNEPYQPMIITDEESAQDTNPK
ncbi:hypothetical protein FIBSPDRAFT_564565 [Athelia psychrophila]|uniref:Uncharacterized protein n=1 Tax=Athelia psychrophila TaxID=1759441 RepID=A0A167TBS5_9AGAM|nr:hypothetical protein FIBSPDRAFT_564565 [Fibularhizoctonia sp. CBS 109695]